MSTTQETAQEQTPTQEQQPAGATDIQALQNQINAMQETFKKELGGLNRRNSELEKQLQEEKMKSMKEEERVAEKLRLDNEERARIVSETIELRKQKALLGAGLPSEFAKRISGTTDDEIAKDVEEFVKFASDIADVKYKQEINKHLGGNLPPLMQQTTTGKTIKRADFDMLKPSAQTETIKAGVKIVD